MLRDIDHSQRGRTRKPGFPDNKISEIIRDDFIGSSLSSVLWTPEYVGDITYTVSNGLIITDCRTGWISNSSIMKINKEIGDYFRLKTEIQFANAATSNMFNVRLGFFNSSNVVIAAFQINDSWGGSKAISYSGMDTGEYLILVDQSTEEYFNSGTFEIEIRKTHNNYRYYFDGNEIGNSLYEAGAVSYPGISVARYSTSYGFPTLTFNYLEMGRF